MVLVGIKVAVDRDDRTRAAVGLGDEVVRFGRCQQDVFVALRVVFDLFGELVIEGIGPAAVDVAFAEVCFGRQVDVFGDGDKVVAIGAEDEQRRNARSVDGLKRSC